jgi:predicted DNA-binding transcriptional regulator AlpA
MKPATLDDVTELLRELVASTRPPSALIDREVFASMLLIGVSTFDRLRAAGDIGPSEIHVGGSIRWHRAEVEAWLATPTPRGDLHTSRTWPTVWKQKSDNYHD